MISLLENKLRAYPRAYITDSELYSLLGGSADSRFSKVKRLLAQEKLLHIRRGLYSLTEKMGYLNKSHPFELAQAIYAPSYISLESALSYHGLIPEAAHAVTSVCAKRAKEFHCPLGVFSYMRLPTENFYTEVELITENNYHFFMAKPWKAICDYVFCYKKEWRSMDPLIHSLRIEQDDLPALSLETMEWLDEYYHHNRISRFLKNIQREQLR